MRVFRAEENIKKGQLCEVMNGRVKVSDIKPTKKAKTVGGGPFYSEWDCPQCGTENTTEDVEFEDTDKDGRLRTSCRMCRQPILLEC